MDLATIDILTLDNVKQRYANLNMIDVVEHPIIKEKTIMYDSVKRVMLVESVPWLIFNLMGVNDRSIEICCFYAMQKITNTINSYQ